MPIKTTINLIGRIVLGAIALAMPCFAQTPVEPNVVILMADDMNWRDSSAYFDLPGGFATAEMPEPPTPNMETLATAGMRFTRCFSASSMCAPLRQQLYTGIYPVRSGAHSNHSEIKYGLPSLPSRLQAEGYRVGIMGKLHITVPELFPFEKIFGDGVTDKTDTEESANIAAAEAFITRAPTEPYCLVITSNNPHAPHTHGDFVGDDSTLPVPPDYVDTPELRGSMNAILGEVKAFDDEVGHWMDFVASSGPNPSNTIFIVLTEQGAGTPSAKWTCYDLGLHSGCIVRWPAAVAPGSTTDAMVEYVDIVPTILEAIAEARGDSQFMPAGLDRLDGRSFLGVLKGQRSAHKKYVYGVQTTKEVIGAPDIGYACRSIRGERYKLIWNLQHDEEFTPGTGAVYGSWVAKATDPGATQEERDHAQLIVDHHTNRPKYQFFDLLTDPYELTNLYSQVQYSNEIVHLTGLLERFMLSQRDKGIATEQITNKDLWPSYDEVHPYAAWTMMYPFVWQADIDPAADPDGDGRDNRTEWLEGTDPLVADTAETKSSIQTAANGSGVEVTLQVPRPAHSDSFGVSYGVEARDSLTSGTWTPVSVAQGGFPVQSGDGYLELAGLTRSETASNRFFRITTTVLTNYHGLPTTVVSGTGPSGSLGSMINILTNDFTVTLDTTLPAGPAADPDTGAYQARSLVDLGAGKGISLTLIGDEFVLSASDAAGSVTGDVWNVMRLEPAEFGKPIQIRMVVDHEAPPPEKSGQDPRGTLFELSYHITGGSNARNGVVLAINHIGYIGSDAAAVGERTTKITGISGEPFGPLSALANGLDDVLPWSSAITYEIVEGQMAHFSKTVTGTIGP